jgi:hypothetical protein
MPYDFGWLDEDQRILSICLSDPLSAEELKTLREMVMSVFEAPAALYVVLDMREFDLKRVFQDAPSFLNGDRFPDFKYHAHHSRLAVVGGGPIVDLLFAVVEPGAGWGGFIRGFKEEDQALTWLREQAGSG